MTEKEVQLNSIIILQNMLSTIDTMTKGKASQVVYDLLLGITRNLISTMIKMSILTPEILLDPKEMTEKDKIALASKSYLKIKFLIQESVGKGFTEGMLGESAIPQGGIGNPNIEYFCVVKAVSDDSTGSLYSS